MLNQLGAPARSPSTFRQTWPGRLGPRPRPLVRLAAHPRRRRPAGPVGCGARHRRSLGLRQVHPARDRQRPARARRGRGAGGRRARARAERPAASTCRSGTCCCLAVRDRQRGARAQYRRGARASRRERRRALRPPGTGRLRVRAPRAALGRHAPAGRLPAHADGRAAGAAAGRALRLAGRHHARRGPGLAGRGAGSRQPHGHARHPRRRGGPLPLRSGGGDEPAPGTGDGDPRRAGAAGHRPRRRGHLDRVRRAARAGAAALLAGGAG